MKDFFMRDLDMIRELGIIGIIFVIVLIALRLILFHKLEHDKVPQNYEMLNLKRFLKLLIISLSVVFGLIFFFFLVTGKFARSMSFWLTPTSAV